MNHKLLRVEDYHLWIKMYAAGYRGYNLSAPIYKMRDDRNAVARRTWTNRMNEFRVRNFAVSALHLPSYARIYSLRPLLVQLMPQFVYNYFHRK
jgi:glycosyltransferase EpsE